MVCGSLQTYRQRIFLRVFIEPSWPNDRSDGVSVDLSLKTAVEGALRLAGLLLLGAPLPSSVATNIFWQVSSDQLQLSWPQDHPSWSLQIQTNSLSKGLGTNWAVVPNSQLANQIFIPINPANGSVFLRLIYP